MCASSVATHQVCSDGFRLRTLLPTEMADNHCGAGRLCWVMSFSSAWAPAAAPPAARYPVRVARAIDHARPQRTASRSGSGVSLPLGLRTPAFACLTRTTTKVCGSSTPASRPYCGLRSGVFDRGSCQLAGEPSGSRAAGRPNRRVRGYRSCQQALCCRCFGA